MTRDDIGEPVHVVDGRPVTSTTLTPHLVVQPATEAIEFYTAVFGAVCTSMSRAGDLVAHAELRLEDGLLTLSDPLEAYGLVAPTATGGSSFSIAIYVSDVDSTVGRARELGSDTLEPLSTFVSGDRFAVIVDPFGVRWSIQTRVEDISAQESRRRVAAWAAGRTGPSD